MIIKNFRKLLFSNIGYQQTIFKNTFWLTLSEFFSKGIYFLVLIWIARHFGPKIYGQWTFALSFVGLFAVLVDFGFKTLIIQELARDKTKSLRYVGNILAIKLILSLIVLGLISVIAQLLGKEPQVLNLIYFLAFYTVINNFSVFFQAIFRANEKMEYETFCQIIQSLSLLGLVALFIFNNSLILNISYAFIGAALTGALFSLVFLWRYFLKLSFKIDFKIWEEIFRKVWPFLFSGIFYIIYYAMGSFMLGMLSNIKEVGYYSAAYNLFIALFIIPEIISMSFFPKLSYFYEKDKLLLKKIFSNFKLIMVIIGLVLTLFSFFLSDFVIVKIYSLKYSSSIILLKILSLIILFKFLSYVYSWFLISSDEQKQNLKIRGLAAFLNIILNYFLIIKYNALGAVFSILITELILLTFYYLSFRIKWNRIYKYKLI